MSLVIRFCLKNYNTADFDCEFGVYCLRKKYHEWKYCAAVVFLRRKMAG